MYNDTALLHCTVYRDVPCRVLSLKSATVDSPPVRLPFITAGCAGCDRCGTAGGAPHKTAGRAVPGVSHRAIGVDGTMPSVTVQSGREIGRARARPEPSRAPRRARRLRSDAQTPQRAPRSHRRSVLRHMDVLFLEELRAQSNVIRSHSRSFVCRFWRSKIALSLCASSQTTIADHGPSEGRGK